MDKDLYRNDFLGRVVFITKDMTGENLLQKCIKQCAEVRSLLYGMSDTLSKELSMLVLHLQGDGCSRIKATIRKATVFSCFKLPTEMDGNSIIAWIVL